MFYRIHRINVFKEISISQVCVSVKFCLLSGEGEAFTTKRNKQKQYRYANNRWKPVLAEVHVVEKGLSPFIFPIKLYKHVINFACHPGEHLAASPKQIFRN